MCLLGCCYYFKYDDKGWEMFQDLLCDAMRAGVMSRCTTQKVTPGYWKAVIEERIAPLRSVVQVMEV
jgi:hypothetical protein